MRGPNWSQKSARSRSCVKVRVMWAHGEKDIDFWWIVLQQSWWWEVLKKPPRTGAFIGVITVKCCQLTVNKKLMLVKYLYPRVWIVVSVCLSVVSHINYKSWTSGDIWYQVIFKMTNTYIRNLYEFDSDAIDSIWSIHSYGIVDLTQVTMKGTSSFISICRTCVYYTETSDVVHCSWRHLFLRTNEPLLKK